MIKTWSPSSCVLPTNRPAAAEPRFAGVTGREFTTVQSITETVSNFPIGSFFFFWGNEFKVVLCCFHVASSSPSASSSSVSPRVPLKMKTKGSK